MARNSFGLSPESKEYIYEEIFQVVRNCNMTYESAWSMPVEVRKWWIRRTSRENEKQAESSREPKSPTPPPWAPKREK